MTEMYEVKPYLNRIKNWKVRNMVMLYLEARDKFIAYRKKLRKGVFISFEKMREICDILFEIKEDHHLLFKRLIEPQKNIFEKAHKFMPDKIETDFMNNIGLLFHKVMATSEVKYVMEHYFEESEEFQKNRENLKYHLNKIDALFDEGIEILKCLISRYRDNVLLLTLLLEDPERFERHFGQYTTQILEQFVEGKGMDEVYFSVGKFYYECGWLDKAQNMLEESLKINPNHHKAQRHLALLN